MKKLYAERDIIEQGNFYSEHVHAMTEEDLRSKSDIAAELAHRDIHIDKLQEELNFLRNWAGVKCSDDLLEKQSLTSRLAAAESQIPEILYDGHKVFSEVQRVRGLQGLVKLKSTVVVSDTLDAIVRLLKKKRGGG